MLKIHPWRVKFEPNSMKFHPFCLKFEPIRFKFHPNSMKIHPNSMKFHPFCLKFEPIRVEIHPRRVKFEFSYFNSFNNSNDYKDIILRTISVLVRYVQYYRIQIRVNFCNSWFLNCCVCPKRF